MQRCLSPLRNVGGAVLQLTATLTRRKVAGMEVASLLLFWLANSVSISFRSSPARPFFCAASNAFMVIVAEHRDELRRRTREDCRADSMKRPLCPSAGDRPSIHC